MSHQSLLGHRSGDASGLKYSSIGKPAIFEDTMIILQLIENGDITRLLFFFALTLFTFNLFVRLRRKGRMTDALPGPYPYPLVGNMLSFDVSSPEKIWQEMRELTQKYYPIAKIWITSEALFSIIHPDDIEVLLTSQKAIQKGWVYDYLHPWLKTGLLTSTGGKWHQRRKILTPAFHFNILKKYMEITSEQGDSMIRELQAKGEETVENLMPLSSRITLNIICESAMGVNLDKIDRHESENYKNAVYKLGNVAVYRMTRPYIQDWMWKLLPFLKVNRDEEQALSHLHKFTDKIVKERQTYHELTGNEPQRKVTSTIEESDDEVYMGPKKRLAMLDLILSAEKGGLIDEEGIKEEVDTFTFEGHDTTAMAITFTLLLLAENKDAQERARSEVTSLLSKTEGKLGISELQELRYLERCIKESLRLYPPVPTVFRYTDEDLVLRHATIPGKSSIVCHFYDVHRDPHFWSEPNKFVLDRFTPENSQNRYPFAYIPFSAGPRNCIGQKFALNEMKSVLGRILYNFRLEPVSRLKDVKLIADLVLRPSKPVFVKFVRIAR